MIGPYARVAFAQGWAATRGPLTDRVKTASVDAARWAAANQHRPGVIEATLRIGHLEGTWAAVFDRRERLQSRHTDAVRRALAGLVDRRAVVRAVRGRHQMETADPVAVDASTLVAGTMTARDRLAALGAALAAAIADGTAEGTADQLALAADRAGAVGFDFDLAFDDALASLAGMDRTWAALADPWVARAVDGAAGDIGAALADLVGRGGGYDEMLDAVGAVLDDGRAAAYITDLALGTALSAGALRLYGSEGVAQAEWVTAGDERVDEQCDELEARSPYPLPDCPTPPAHGFCRCVLQPVEEIPDAAFERYVTDVMDEG